VCVAQCNAVLCVRVCACRCARWCWCWCCDCGFSLCDWWPGRTTTVDRTGPDRTGLDRTRICSGGGCGLVLGRGRRAFRRAPANEHRTGTLSSDFQLQHFISHRCHESSPSRSDEDSSGARTPPMPTHIARYEVSSCRSPFCTAITSVHSLVPVVPHLPLVPTSTKPTRPQPSAAAVGRPDGRR
jgi:hypothetical protein